MKVETQLILVQRYVELTEQLAEAVRLLQQVARHFEDTDAPLGVSDRAFLTAIDAKEAQP